MLTAPCILAFLLAVPWRSARSWSREVSKSTARLGPPKSERSHYSPAVLLLSVGCAPGGGAKEIAKWQASERLNKRPIASDFCWWRAKPG